MKASIAALALLCVVLGSCANDPKTSAEYLELESRLDAAEQQLADAAAEETAMPPIVADFKAAYESGDLDQVRALYASDGIFATTDDVHGLYYGNEALLGTWGLDGSEFIRTATLHNGEMTIVHPVAIGDRAVAFGWEWEDFASGTATLHLRDGRIVVATLAVTEFEIPPARNP